MASGEGGNLRTPIRRRNRENGAESDTVCTQEHSDWISYLKKSRPCRGKARTAFLTI